MKPLLELIGQGGPVVLAIMALSIILYARCFRLLSVLRRSRIELRRAAASPLPPEDAVRMQREARGFFREQRFVLGSMIAAAPLLGLLGTVSGMARTFETLSAGAGEKTVQGLAGGISEVLVATESGLMVALPALLLVWFAHREMVRLVRELNPLDAEVRRAYR
jgi:biopolymer transport protein ExbB